MPDESRIKQQLVKLLKRAHARYSKFRVAAAAVDEFGNVHFGVNVENQSFPVGTCAEAAAIGALRTAGGKKIKRLYLVSSPDVGVLPCGACRQRLAELGSPDTTIISLSNKFGTKSFSLAELFPHSFRFK